MFAVKLKNNSAYEPVYQCSMIHVCDICDRYLDSIRDLFNIKARCMKQSRGGLQTA